MKKILVLAAVLSASVGVSAEKLMVTYDEVGILSGVEFYEEEKEYTYPEGFCSFIYDMDTEEKVKYTKKTQEPEPEPEPVPEPVPEPEPEQEPEPLLGVYENKRDALAAIAVVVDKSRIMKDDEEVWKIGVLYQGGERDFYIADEAVLGSVPDAFPELSGSGVGVLKKGDVINISASLSGKIREVNLIMRADVGGIMSGENDYGYNFEKLYSEGGKIKWSNTVIPTNVFGQTYRGREQYQFGVVRDKRDLYYTIINKAGKADEVRDIQLDPETIVYVCDIGKKFKVSLGTTADIVASVIPQENFDEESNIISWDGGEYVYALSRTINDIAAEVVVFTK